MSNCKTCGKPHIVAIVTDEYPVSDGVSCPSEITSAYSAVCPDLCDIDMEGLRVDERSEKAILMTRLVTGSK